MILWEPTWQEVAPPAAVEVKPVVIKSAPVDWIEEECSRG